MVRWHSRHHGQDGHLELMVITLTARTLRTPRPAVFALLLLALALLPATAHAAPGDPCAAPADVIACENSKPGTPQSVWGVSGGGDPSIQGYATQMSVNHGEQVQFKVKTDASLYEIKIYRIGYYQGDGARLIDTIAPSAPLPQNQPACANDTTTGLIDCGTWGVSATWQSPPDAVSGVYVAHLRRPDTNAESQIIFVVRDDERASDVVIKTADETWTAYNAYGGISLYGHSSGTSWWSGRGYKVSYNRPLTMREDEVFSSFYSSEYPMVRWMERNGYDVSYMAGVDFARRAAELREHKLLVSSGHDEYWSAEQRSNVEAARDAGVNLAFFSGNEIYWKTRWEPSIDGLGVADRTLVSYKESNAATKLDPSPLWTGTWRDARFSPPSDGGRPENALTGTLYKVNAYRNDAIEIPQAHGRARFWRSTGIDALTQGQKAALPNGVLGYEWDVDADNGHRPAGLIRLSSTTIDVPTQYLLDYGTQYGAGRATHSLTLYKAPSGALVFGAGTVQWAWGLDGRHDNDGPNPDPRMQQATVNLFADMGLQPGTLQEGLLVASPSTDTAAPSATITGPAAGSKFSRNKLVTVSGTAIDSGGGVVAAIEVSTDGGQSWHPADGHESWQYSWRVDGYGPADVRARAVDDSGNIGTSDQRALEVGCPCTVWSDNVTPGTADFADSLSYELGFKFRAQVDGYVTGVRFYKGAGNTGTHLGHLWTSTGTRLGEVKFEAETATGWQQASFSKPIAVTAGTTYVASYYAPNGHYALDRPYFAGPVVAAPLRALADGEDGPNALFKSGPSSFPTQSKLSSNYWVDVVFDTDGTDRVGPGVLSVKPTAGTSSASISSDVTVKFDEDVDPASLTSDVFELRDAAGTPVPATIRYDAPTQTATLDPAASLNLDSNYTATLRGGPAGARDLAGNTLSANRVWSFKTFTCPCSLWPNNPVPADTSSSDPQAYELGVKFRSEVSGYVTGIRFYKGSGNTGSHLGHLWTAGGTRIGEVVFTNETATGWQVATFSRPIAVNAGTTYVASYFAPNGRFALDRPFFGTAFSNGPLRALADGEEGGNAVFKVGTSGFPTQSKLASNYWVDVVFHQDGTDNSPPRVTSVKPVSGSTSSSANAHVTAELDEALDPASVSTSSFALTTAAGAPVPASVSYDAATRSAVLDPVDPLQVSTSYRAVLRGGPSGLRDVAGNALAADYEWTFTTFTCPCSLWPNTTLPATAAFSDFSSYELGVKFKAEVSGFVTGIRFYKGSGNGGTHLGHLWTATGTRLGEVTFANETLTGWQQASFAEPIAVTAGTTYVASYYAPAGRYSLDRPYFANGYSRGPLRALTDGEEGGNAVFKSGTSGFPIKAKEASNYWVDLVFVAG
jgi:hypothetical protein